MYSRGQRRSRSVCTIPLRQTGSAKAPWVKWQIIPVLPPLYLVISTLSTKTNSNPVSFIQIAFCLFQTCLFLLLVPTINTYMVGNFITFFLIALTHFFPFDITSFKLGKNLGKQACLKKTQIIPNSYIVIMVSLSIILPQGHFPPSSTLFHMCSFMLSCLCPSCFSEYVLTFSAHLSKLLQGTCSVNSFLILSASIPHFVLCTLWCAACTIWHSFHSVLFCKKLFTYQFHYSRLHLPEGRDLSYSPMYLLQNST